MTDGDTTVLMTITAPKITNSKINRKDFTDFPLFMETHFAWIDNLIWFVGFVLELAVFVLAKRPAWKRLQMLRVYSGFRASADIALFIISRDWPSQYNRADWDLQALGYVLMGLLVIQIADENIVNRRWGMTMYFMALMTVLIVAGGVVAFADSTSPLLRLTRFADGISLLSLVPAFRKRGLPRPFLRMAIALGAILAIDFGCSTIQAFDHWRHWDIVARLYDAGLILGWAGLTWVAAIAPSPHFRKTGEAPEDLASHPESLP
jgi:hypothetical protein